MKPLGLYRIAAGLTEALVMVCVGFVALKLEKR